MFPSLSNLYPSKSNDIEMARSASSPVVSSSSAAETGSEKMMKDTRLTWSQKRSKFVKQRGKGGPSSDDFPSTLKDKKGAKAKSGFAHIKPSMSSLELGALLEQPAATLSQQSAALSPARAILYKILAFVRCLRRLRPLERLKSMSLRSLMRLGAACLALSSLMLMSYTVYIRLSDARKASQLIRSLGHDGHTSPVTHIPKFYGINKDKDQGRCIFQYDLDDDADTSALLRKWDLQNPSIISTLMVR